MCEYNKAYRLQGIDQFCLKVAWGGGFRDRVSDGIFI